METLCFGIDVGFGNTKYSFGKTEDGEIATGIFPSCAPLTTNFGSKDYLDKKNTFIVPGNDGNFHQVGRDSILEMGQNSGRILDSEFPMRSEYRALLNGALCHIGREKIDSLCIGLPVSSIDALASAVREQAIGIHKLPIGEVEVLNVVVVPQPIGGLFDFATRNNRVKEMRMGKNLLIDPGYYTLDWVVSEGLVMIKSCSGAINNAGMSPILNRIMESIVSCVNKRDGKNTEVTEYLMEKLDIAIRTNAPFYINGKVEDIRSHMHASDAIIRDALNKMLAGVGALSEITNIILVGGGSHLYHKQIVEKFKGYSLKMVKNPEFSNVRGFHLLAEQVLKYKSVR